MKLRVWLLTFVVVLANVSGNVILKQAMLYAPPSAGPIASILQPVAILGISVLTAWMLLRMWLLGMADLSFVVPVSAVGYVLAAVAGAVFFHERVPARGWIGTVVIMLGAILTGLTEHSQLPAASSPHASLASPDRDLLLSRDREGADARGGADVHVCAGPPGSAQSPRRDPEAADFPGPPSETPALAAIPAPSSPLSASPSKAVTE